MVCCTSLDFYITLVALWGLPNSFVHLPGLVYQPDHLSGILYHPGYLVGLPNGFLHLPGPLYHHLQPLESLCTSVQKNENHFTPTIFYMNIIFIWRFETESLVTCISSFNFLCFFFLSIFSRGLLDVDGCDNAALCCLREDEDAAGCRSESVTCLPAIQYIHIKNMLYIFFDLLNP